MAIKAIMLLTEVRCAILPDAQSLLTVPGGPDVFELLVGLNVEVADVEDDTGTG